jgi:MMP 1-O-methyltransferase
MDNYLKGFLKSLRHAWHCRKIRGWEKIDGFLLPEEACLLYRYSFSLPRGSSVCEIGSYKGKSTVCLGRGLVDSGSGRMIVIDPFDGSGDIESAAIYSQTMGDIPLLEQFKKNIEMMNISSIIDIKVGTSRLFADEIEEIDLLFIDGDHSIAGCLEDYELYGKKVKQGGYLLFHDYDPIRKNLGPTYVIETVVSPSMKWVFIEKIGSLWVGRRS